VAVPLPEPPVEATVEVPAEPPAVGREAKNLSVVERGFALLEARRVTEAVALAHEAIQARKAGAPLVPTPAAAEESARLWGLLGLARQALDDLEGARFALEESIAVAPRSERATWERHLVALVLARGRQALERIAA
jgi:tetratricopeptide (TPR) repeat protein